MKIQEIKEQFGNCPTERLPELIEAYKEDERSGIKAEMQKRKRGWKRWKKKKRGCSPCCVLKESMGMPDISAALMR